jgi:hypothetical protein
MTDFQKKNRKSCKKYKEFKKNDMNSFKKKSRSALRKIKTVQKEKHEHFR